MSEIIELEVDGQVVRGCITVLYSRILAVEMTYPSQQTDPLGCYSDRISPADAERGIVYCRQGKLTPLGLKAAKEVLRRQYLAAKRKRDG